MILTVVLVMMAMYLGYWYRDRHIRATIGDASMRAMGSDVHLVGTAIDYMRCMAILGDDDIRATLEAM